MSRPFLIMRLEAPLMSYGAVAVDAMRPSADFPGLSMLTGLLARALGWSHYSYAPRTQRLQDRIVYAARNESLARDGNAALADLQTAQLSRSDAAWTTKGIPERRAGSPDTYMPPHLRTLEYRVNLRTTVALELDDPGEEPTLTDLAHALTRPASVLFIGRKACLPSEPICQGIITAESPLDALASTPSASVDHDDAVQWNGDHQHPSVTPLRQHWAQDIKDWRNELHTGRRPVATGTMTKPAGPARQEPSK